MFYVDNLYVIRTLADGHTGLSHTGRSVIAVANYKRVVPLGRRLCGTLHGGKVFYV